MSHLRLSQHDVEEKLKDQQSWIKSDGSISSIIQPSHQNKWGTESWNLVIELLTTLKLLSWKLYSQVTSSDPRCHFKSTQAWNGVVGPGALPPTLQLSVKLPVQNPDCGKTETAKWFLPGFQPSEAARLQVSLMFINLHQFCMQMSIAFYPLVTHPFIHLLPVHALSLAPAWRAFCRSTAFSAAREAWPTRTKRAIALATDSKIPPMASWQGWQGDLRSGSMILLMLDYQGAHNYESVNPYLAGWWSYCENDIGIIGPSSIITLTCMEVTFLRKT